MNGTGTRAAGASLVELLTVDQWRILRALADGDGHSMGRLADALAMPTPTLTRLTEGLVDLGRRCGGHTRAPRRT